MCGIYGTTIQHEDALIRKKLNLINFRGPDFSGFERTDGAVLGHNRLAIIDLDKRSNQPFSYQHLKIVFNGEIYNYKDIRKELAKKGYKFFTTSDTEVICAAYLAYGKNCVNYFNGMFAFMIYDTIEKKFFGARDRFGKKPFYYSTANNEFEFASQSSAIALGRKFTVSNAAIREFLIRGSVHEPNSIWDGIKKLPAAHTLIYNLRESSISIEKYWDLDYKWENRFLGNYKEAESALHELLLDAVKIRMNADVPLGVFLSGGIDSSLTASLASTYDKTIKSFTIKFQEAGFDESPFAKQVAEHLGTNHYEIDCTYREGMELIQNFNRYYDEPFADSSAIPSMLLAKHTREHVTVALSGDGGDEGFIGYTRYKWINDVNTLFKLPLSIRKILAEAVQLSPNYRHKLIGMGLKKADIAALYLEMGRLENSGFENSGLIDDPHALILGNPWKPLLENLSDYDIKTYLNAVINTKVDRATMAFSLEARAPLLDYRVIEFARSLPTKFKYAGKGNQKRILKDILYQYVPAEVFKRPKAGFTLPIKEWFRNELKDYVLDNLNENALKSIPGVNPKRIIENVQEHMQGKWNRTGQIWKLLVLINWMKQKNDFNKPASEVMADVSL